MATISVIHGPNLNLLGTREVKHYGHQTLGEINTQLQTLAASLGISLDLYQSNHEGALIDHIQSLAHTSNFIIINPAGLTHTSVCLRDTLLAVQIPFIEVHLSNVHKREDFRRISYLADIAVGTISGLGASGYLAAFNFANNYLTNFKPEPSGANETPWTYEKLEN